MVPVAWTPDLDTAWSVNPGALVSVGGLAPLRNGNYASAEHASLFALTGTDHLHAKMFRQVDGSVRLLTFRSADIDEYSNSGTRTNRGTGYSTSTDWDAAAWGNQIIAVSYANATQSSTGAGFTSLGGSSPKARRIAANINFVMMADVDDGGSNVYSDMVWWCGLRNPAVWTPSPATQAGYIRLLDAPGPIKALVAYRDTFVAFKDNAIFVGQYVGPPYVFNWRMVSNRIGCVAPHSVVECQGKLYFIHNSGIFEFDGQSIRDVGLPVFQSILNETGTVSLPGYGTLPPTVGETASPISKAQGTADDLEGNVWFTVYASRAGTSKTVSYLYGYNVVSQKWGRYGSVATGGTSSINPLVQASYADMMAFSAGLNSVRFLLATSDNDLRAFQYPIASTGASLTTGILGENQKSTDTLRVWPRTRYGSSQAPFASGSISGFTDEAGNLTGPGTATLTANSEFDCLDGKLAGKYRRVSLTGGASKILILGGLDIEGSGYPSRR